MYVETIYSYIFSNPIKKISLFSSYWLFLDSPNSSSFLFDTDIVKWHILIWFKYYKFIMKTINNPGPILFSLGANTAGLNGTLVYNQVP